MTEFDPERFADKYEHYFPELQTAYRNAFERMGERYDSTLVHSIDQQVLNESEPFYDGDERTGEFSVELPENAHERLTDVVIDEEKLETVLEEYREVLIEELHTVFEVERAE